MKHEHKHLNMSKADLYIDIIIGLSLAEERFSSWNVSTMRQMKKSIRLEITFKKWKM